MLDNVREPCKKTQTFLLGCNNVANLGQRRTSFASVENSCEIDVSPTTCFIELTWYFSHSIYLGSSKSSNARCFLSLEVYGVWSPSYKPIVDK